VSKGDSELRFAVTRHQGSSGGRVIESLIDTH